MSEPTKNRPRAFPVGAVDAERRKNDFVIEEQADRFAAENAVATLSEDEVEIEAAQAKGIVRRGIFSWTGLFWSATAALASLALGLWIDSLIEAAFAKFAVLGWIATTLAGAVVLALVALTIRELLGVSRQKRIAALHARLAAALASDDREAARRGVRDLAALYVDRAEVAAARRRVLDLTHEIVDARDLLEITERALILPLDRRVRAEVARAAKRVSMITTLSPRALLDVLFVAGQAVRLVRVVAEIYGGRPGLLGLVRIGRSVLAHIAITGGMAVGDSLLQQIVGHGLAARLSARLGEGVLNGLLTARVGLSAIAVCRPTPYIAESQPGVADVAPFLFAKDEK